MHMNNAADPNSRGWGLLLRLAGAIVPLAALFVLGVMKDTLPATGLLSVVKGIGVPWGWPYHAYRAAPLGFGGAGLLTALFTAALLFRKDWRGAVSIVIWSVVWAWGVFAYLLTDPS